MMLYFVYFIMMISPFKTWSSFLLQSPLKFANRFPNVKFIMHVMN